MARCRNQEGVEFDAEQLSEPRLLNTMFGECAAEPGSWVVTSPELDRPVVFTNAAFQAAFTLVE